MCGQYRGGWSGIAEAQTHSFCLEPLSKLHGLVDASCSPVLFCTHPLPTPGLLALLPAYPAPVLVVFCCCPPQFCYTGRMGLLGNLTTAQIVEQLVEARRWLEDYTAQQQQHQQHQQQLEPQLQPHQQQQQQQSIELQQPGSSSNSSSGSRGSRKGSHVQQAPRINNIVFMVRVGLQVVWQL